MRRKFVLPVFNYPTMERTEFAARCIWGKVRQRASNQNTDTMQSYCASSLATRVLLRESATCHSREGDCQKRHELTTTRLFVQSNSANKESQSPASGCSA